MKKLILLFFSLLTIGYLFQACDNSKTYAEMLEDERNAVSKFIKEQGINVISKDEFEKDTITNVANNEYVAFSNGVYMQIVNRGLESDAFASNDIIVARYMEKNLLSKDTTCWDVVIPGKEDWTATYQYPAAFRYVLENTSSYGVLIDMDNMWYEIYGSTAVPAGWLVALPYVRDCAYVRLIVPSKMGHSYAQQNVVPYFYEMRKLTKW